MALRVLILCVIKVKVKTSLQGRLYKIKEPETRVI